MESIDRSYDAIVDALFGFSFKPPVRPEFENIVNKLVNTALPVISIDVPSGKTALSCDIKQDLCHTFKSTICHCIG